MQALEGQHIGATHDGAKPLAIVRHVTVVVIRERMTALLHPTKLSLQFVGRPQVIGVQERQETRLRHCDGHVARRSGPAVLRHSQDFDACISGAQAQGFFCAAVGRAVVHQQMFEPLEALSTRRFKQPGQPRADVVHRRDDGDFDIGHGATSFLTSAQRLSASASPRCRCFINDLRKPRGSKFFSKMPVCRRDAAHHDKR